MSSSSGAAVSQVPHLSGPTSLFMIVGDTPPPKGVFFTPVSKGGGGGGGRKRMMTEYSILAAPPETLNINIPFRKFFF